MTFVITQPCIDTTDQACVEVCPVDCIHFEEGADRMLYINPAECIDCGACQPACPVQAIFPEGDVPGDQQHFIGINSTWYDDRAAARSQLGGASAAAAAPAAATPAEAPAATSEAPAAAAEAGAATEAAPVAAAAAAPAAPTAHVSQVSADVEEHHGHGVQASQYNQPSPKGLVMAVGFIVGIVIMFVFTGPTVIDIGHSFTIDPPIGWALTWGGTIPLGVMVGLPIALFFLGGFLDSQVHDLGLFAAKGPRGMEQWRDGYTNWRRSEETRRFDQERAVKALVESRFAFPTDSFPDYRTHVNVPEATMALEFGGGGGEKVFPDILVVEYPGNYPRIVAQVETRETVTRAQAERVWKAMENEEAPLYIYVPAGYGNVAKDYARAAGIKHAQVRTWRRQPTGVVVAEV